MKKRKSIRRDKYFSFIVFFLFCVLSVNLSVANANSDAYPSFDDYVRGVERKNQPVAQKTNLEGFADEKWLWKISSLFIASLGITFFFITRRKYKKPYQCSIKDIGHLLEDEKLEDFINSMTVLEVSSIYNLCEFSKYDLIAVMFDLVSKGVLQIQMPVEVSRDNISLIETKIVVLEKDSENLIKELNGYESFLISWFAGKMGDKTYFHISDIGKYIALDSRAAEFDIDYDIWLDEVRDGVSIDKIVDTATAKWKKLCGYAAILYVVFGLFMLHIAGIMASFLFFMGALIFIKFSDNVVRRSKDFQNKFVVIEKYKLFVEDIIKRKCEDSASGAELCDLETWNRRFVYSIAIGNVEKFFLIDNKYEDLYYILEAELDKAIEIANKKINAMI